jgi:hypothetical protein
MCSLSTLACSIATLLPHKSLSYISNYSQVNDICYRILCSMTSDLHPTLFDLDIHQIHLNLEDDGFSLPNMLLNRDNAFPQLLTLLIFSIP